MDGIRVALVEDHDLTRAGLRVALQQSREVEMVGEAPNGVEGLKLLETTLPDVAIVDIGLPGIDGIELTRRFKQFLHESEDPEQGKTKVLMLTMQDNEEAVLAAFAAGADSYCMKDASLEQLLEALQVTSAGNHWIDPAIARIVLQQIQDRQNQQGIADTAEENKTISIHGVDPEYDQILSADPLTQRELEVLELIVKGHSNAEIASKLYITVGTVKTHVRNILNKLCADDRTQAAVLALRSGLVT
uniref:Two component transcriptional regulator, LuxR family n=1 Tax=Cyanothece sp. (strain PCC 7425 / ATCC 29141) TaxID=395961 RepID=B8HKL8_CYAP4